MTVRTIYRDDRTWKSSSGFGSDYLFGLFLDYRQSGANASPKGDRSPHDYDLRVENHYRGDATCVRTSPDGTILNTGTSTFWNGIDFPGVSSLDGSQEALLLDKLADQIRNSPFDTGVFIGELGETVDLVAGSARKLATGARQISQGNVAGALRTWGVPDKLKRAPKSAGQAWLATRYGWRPIVNDIYNLSKQIENLDKVRKKKIVVSVGKTGKAYSGITGGKFSCTGSWRVSKQLIAYLTETEQSLFSSIGLQDPAATAWELLPASFIVDWSFPIGNYLRTRSTLADVQATFVTTSVTKLSGRLGGGEFFFDESLGGNRVTVSNPQGFYNYVEVRRRVTPSLSVPLPQLRNPLGGNPWTRAADAFTLLGSAVGSFSRR